MTNLLNLFHHHRRLFIIKYQDVTNQRLRTFIMWYFAFMFPLLFLTIDKSKETAKRFPIALTDFLSPIVKLEPIISTMTLMLVTALTYFADTDKKYIVAVISLIGFKLMIPYFMSM